MSGKARILKKRLKETAEELRKAKQASDRLSESYRYLQKQHEKISERPVDDLARILNRIESGLPKLKSLMVDVERYYQSHGSQDWGLRLIIQPQAFLRNLYFGRNAYSSGNPMVNTSDLAALVDIICADVGRKLLDMFVKENRQDLK